jgi:hypothetical protein
MVNNDSCRYVKCQIYFLAAKTERRQIVCIRIVRSFKFILKVGVEESIVNATLM